MNIEIERKFLVGNDDWKLDIKSSCVLRDGLLSSSAENKVRIRIQREDAFITIKSKKIILTRTEYEYPVNLEEAEEMLANLCGKLVCHKTRHQVPCASHIWSVDVYGGVMDGVVIAEIELSSETEEFVLPAWIGTEVTKQAAFGKWKMLAHHHAASMNVSQLTSA